MGWMAPYWEKYFSDLTKIFFRLAKRFLLTCKYIFRRAVGSLGFWQKYCEYSQKSFSDQQKYFSDWCKNIFSMARKKKNLTGKNIFLTSQKYFSDWQKDFS